MPAYNYLESEFPEQNKVEKRLTWGQIIKFCTQIGLSIPTMILSLIFYPFSKKRTGPLTDAFASVGRRIITNTTRDDTLQKAVFFQPLERTLGIFSSYKSTRGYNTLFTEATKSNSRWIYEKEDRTKDDPVMVYIHGGGFETKALLDHVVHVHTLCKETGISAMLVDYGTIPYFKFPSQLDECIDTITALSNSCDKIIVAGDSAGGNLAAACSLKLKELKTPIWGCYMIAPWVQLYPRETGSWKTNADHDWITAPWLLKAAQLYLDHGKYDNNKLAQPYLATKEDWKGAMPKNSLLVYGSCELFADMSHELAQTANVTSVFAEARGIHDYNLIFEKSGPTNDYVVKTIKSWL